MEEHDLQLYFRRATEYRVMRNRAEAEADLRRALERDPGNTRALTYFRSPRVERPAGD